MEDLWHHSVMQAGWKVFSKFLQCMCFSVEGEECLSGNLCCRCCTQSRRSSTGDAFFVRCCLNVEPLRLRLETREQ